MSKKRIIAFYIASFTWGILWTLIGLVIASAICMINIKNIEVSTYLGRIKVRIKNKSFGGISLGIVFIVDKYNSQRINRHEVGHTIQNCFLGPLFIPLVAIPSGIRYQLFDYLDKRHYNKYGKYLDYDAAWFEHQATVLGEKLHNKQGA